MESVLEMVVSLVSALVRWVWRRSSADFSRSVLAPRANDLADLVKHTERQRLTDLGVLPGQPVFPAWTLAEPVRCRQSGVTDLVEYYRQIPSGRLLVAGGAGMGKTVAGLQLLLDVLGRRHPAEPVPVRFNLSTWNPLSTSVSQWLTRQLVRDYSLSWSVARALVDRGWIVPVLDGLDEMDLPTESSSEGPPERAACALQQLSEPPWRGRRVVVTSRSETLEQLRAGARPAVLAGSVTVELQRLTAAQIIGHLRDSAVDAGIDPETWAPLFDKLQAEPDCTAAVTLAAPWLLSLALDDLISGGPAAVEALIAAADVDEVRERLFTQQIARAVTSQPRDKHGRRPYTEKQVFTWLYYLGTHLKHQRRVGIRLNQIWELAGNRSRWVHAGLAFVLAWLAWGLQDLEAFVVTTSGVLNTWPLRDSPSFTRPAPFVATLLLSVPCLFGGVVRDTRAYPIVMFAGTAADKRRWLWALIAGAIAGLVAWLVTIVSLSGSGWSDPQGSTLASLWFLLAGSAVFGPIALSRRKPLALDEKRLIRNDFQAASTTSLLCWLTVSSISLISFQYWFWLVEGRGIAVRTVAAASAAAVVVAPTIYLPLTVLVFAYLTSFHYRASVRYIAATLIFRLDHRFPRRPAQFLEWARSVGLLRVTGAAYQFRHDTYQHWLITQPPPTTRTTS